MWLQIAALVAIQAISVAKIHVVKTTPRLAAPTNNTAVFAAWLSLLTAVPQWESTHHTAVHAGTYVAMVVDMAAATLPQ